MITFVAIKYLISVLSAYGDTKLVMKGISHGACDYLLKPVRLEELKNIWQHVIRKKKSDPKEKSKTCKPDKTASDSGSGLRSAGTENTDENGKLTKKRKDQDEDEDEDKDNGNDNEDPSAQKKPRVVWSVELHRKFVAAVNQLGIDSMLFYSLQFKTTFYICSIFSRFTKFYLLFYTSIIKIFFNIWFDVYFHPMITIFYDRCHLGEI
jgi:YesN/AraC family two-component response regulator